MKLAERRAEIAKELRQHFGEQVEIDGYNDFARILTEGVLTYLG